MRFLWVFPCDFLSGKCVMRILKEEFCKIKGNFRAICFAGIDSIRFLIVLWVILDAVDFLHGNFGQIFTFWREFKEFSWLFKRFDWNNSIFHQISLLFSFSPQKRPHLWTVSSDRTRINSFVIISTK